MPTDATSTAMRLRDGKDLILRLWEERVRSEILESNKYPRPVLLDSMPNFLEQVACQLEGKQRDACSTSDVCKEHGDQRASLTDYTIDQLLQEYKLLRTAVFEVLEHDGPVTTADRDKILESIFAGIRDSAMRYVERQLQSIAAERESAQRHARNLEIEHELREQFVSTLSHDMRGPLTAARASAQMLLRHSQALEMRQSLATRIINNIDRADRMIRDLLDANQIRAGKKLPITIIEFDLHAMAAEVLEELTTVHGDRFELSGDAPLVGHWSESQLRRALENLLSNAIKYGFEHTPIVVNLAANETGVRISVQNWGKILTPAEQKVVFERFYRADSAHRSGKRGWGLGLTLVRGIAEAHGGTVSVTSNDADGTVFTMILPLDARKAAGQSEPRV